MTPNHICFKCQQKSCRVRITRPWDEGYLLSCDRAVLSHDGKEPGQKKLTDNEQSILFKE